MKYRPLGTTGLNVSALCLGTMTWGQQNTEAEGHEQLSYAVDQGINFIDTAELYAVPPRVETQGSTERIIGSWLKARGQRDDLIIASKIVGPGLAHFRNGKAKLDRANIEEALNASLTRLNTDYLDVYYVHWPERSTNYFGRLGYTHHTGDDFTPLLETLEALDAQVKAGKVRHIAISNETAWGLMTYTALAEKHGLSRIACIQNPYNLLNRSFEVGLSEPALRENVPLCAYSPLAFGALSGKYLNDQRPDGARLTLFKEYKRYTNPQALDAIERYVAVAQEYHLDPAQMALAFVTSRDFVAANIIGATTMEQLKSNIASIDIDLHQDVLDAIESIHVDQPNPGP